MSEVYNFFLDESPKYFEYEADCQGLSHISIGSPVQLAQVLATPCSTLFTFEEFAAAVTLTHPLSGPVTSMPVSPSLSYTSLSGITSLSSLPTELLLPASWADWSPSPIDYEGISEWAEEATEVDPPALPHFAVFHQGLDGPEAPFVLENLAPVAKPALAAAPEIPVGPPLEFLFPAVEPVQPPVEQLPPPTPHPVFLEQLLPTPQSPVPASPRLLSPLPSAEEAHLENQENVPPVEAGPVFSCRPCINHPVLHPHQFFAVPTSYSPEWRPRGELSLGDALEVLLVSELVHISPQFPSVIPFQGGAPHHITIKPVIPNISAQFMIPPVYACGKAVCFPPNIGVTIGVYQVQFP